MEPVADKWRACGWETEEIDGNDMDMQRLLRQLVAADCGLISFADKEPTLEDVFLDLTDKTLRD